MENFNYIIYVSFYNGDCVQVATADTEENARYIVGKLDDALKYSAADTPMAFFIKNDDRHADFICKKIELHI